MHLEQAFRNDYFCFRKTVFQNGHFESKNNHSEKSVLEISSQRECGEALKRTWHGELEEERNFYVGTFDDCGKKT